MMRKGFNWKQKLGILLAGILLVQTAAPAMAATAATAAATEAAAEAATAEAATAEAEAAKKTTVSGNLTGEGTFGTKGVISGFVPWTEEEESIWLEPKLSLKEMNQKLGDRILVYLDDSTEPAAIPVEWECAEDYEGSDTGIYHFMPVWDTRYYTASDTLGTLPRKEVSIMDELYTIPPLTYRDIEGGEQAKSVINDPAYSGPDYAPLLEARFSPLDADTRDLPPVRNQNPYGTCWAFSSLGMGEVSSLVEREQAVDLSELHLAYFSYNTVADPLGGLEGDSNRASGATFMDRGGNLALSYQILADWTGAADESMAPYGDAPSALSSGLDPGIAYQDSLHLQGAYKIKIKTDAAIVKQKVKEKGGVGTSYFEDGRNYNNTYQSYYNATDRATNHAVMIVGWDDNFPKANFNTEAPGDGAWLIRNSWGGGDNYGHYSYFWMSYYDISLDVAYVFDYEEADNYAHNYQYDGSMQDCDVKYCNGKATFANVFTAKANDGGREMLRAAAFHTKDVNMDYKLEIYKNLSDPANPESGTLVTEATTEGKTDLEGYYTISLRNPVALNEGDTFAIVVTLTKSGKMVCIVGEGVADAWYVTRTAAKEGQSFIREGWGWNDCGQELNLNLRVKAFTDNLTPLNPVTGISLDTVTKEIGKNESFTIHAAVTPENADSSIQWESSDDTVAAVDSTGKVTGQKAGTAVITASADGVTASCTVTVKIPAASVTLSETAETIKKGDTLVLQAQVLPADTTDPVEWTSLDRTVASVDSNGKVTGIKAGETVIRAAAGEVSADCTVTVTSPITALTLNVTAKKLMLAESYQLKASVVPGDTTDAVSWKSSDADIVTVDELGNVKGVDSGQAVITAAAGTKTASCTVTVDFPFKDVPAAKNNWKHQGVRYVYAEGLMAGVGSDTFAPDIPLTRAMFVTVLYRMAGRPDVVYTDKFKDVPAGRWYSNAIIWANREGIVMGLGDGIYGGDRNITREQTAAMLYRYAQYKGYDLSTSASLDSFLDVNSVSGWAKKSMEWVVDRGVINGRVNGEGKTILAPEGEATRAECASIIMRFANR